MNWFDLRCIYRMKLCVSRAFLLNSRNKLRSILGSKLFASNVMYLCFSCNIIFWLGTHSASHMNLNTKKNKRYNRSPKFSQCLYLTTLRISFPLSDWPAATLTPVIIELTRVANNQENNCCDPWECSTFVFDVSSATAGGSLAWELRRTVGTGASQHFPLPTAALSTPRIVRNRSRGP